MIIENVDQFSAWLIGRLNGLCEADPVTLTRYVIALLKKDKSENSLKKICNEQLNVFLGDKTQTFVVALFDSIKTKKYIKATESDVNNDFENVLPDFVEKDSVDKKKSTYEDTDILPEFQKYASRSREMSLENETSGVNDKRSPESHSFTKRTREYSSHRNYDEGKKRRKYNEDQDLRDRKRHSSRHKSHRNYSHKYYERNEDSKLIKYSNEKKQWDIKTSCPDFVEKGVCLKGDSCEFDHGTDIVRSDINCIYSGANMPQTTINPTWQNINSTWMDYPGTKSVQSILPIKKADQRSYQVDVPDVIRSNKSDIYDPSHPEIDAQNLSVSNSVNGVGAGNENAPVYVPSKIELNQKDSPWYRENEGITFCEGSRVTTVIGRQRNGGASGNSRRRPFNKGPGGDNRYSNRKQGVERCLLLTHIPTDCNDRVSLRRHFQQFGIVTDIQINFQGDPHNALVEFASVDQARQAYRSPLPILDNRFIRTSLYCRPIESSNLTLCSDSFAGDNNDGDILNAKRKVLGFKSNENQRESVELSESDQIHQQPQLPQQHTSRRRVISDGDRSVVSNEDTKRSIIRECRYPDSSELRLDRRINEADQKQQSIFSSKSIIDDSQKIEAKKDRQKKLDMINEKKEVKSRIDKLEESVESCRKRLRVLLEEQKKPDCDQDLVKRQLLESYNYFKDLREMLESLKKKHGSSVELTEEEKLKLKIKDAQTQLSTMNSDEDEYRKQLRTITELKRELVKLQTISKGQPGGTMRIPTRVEMKLDNRPKILFIDGLTEQMSVDYMKKYLKGFYVDKMDLIRKRTSRYFEIDFKTRREADRFVKEMPKSLRDQSAILSFDRPIEICDPLDFQDRTDVGSDEPLALLSSSPSQQQSTQRGTPSRRNEFASSDEDDDDDDMDEQKV